MDERSAMVYNPHRTGTGIPPEAQRYVIDGKIANEWLLDRQQVKTDSKSGISRGSNNRVAETVNDLRKPSDLLLRVDTASLRTTRGVGSEDFRSE